MLADKKLGKFVPHLLPNLAGWHDLDILSGR